MGGPGGSGKTVACKLVAQELSISCLTGSEIMMNAAGVSTRDELDALPENVKDELRLNAFEAYYKATPNMVIDGHFYLTEKDISYFNAFVLVEVDLERLVRFREDDTSRKRSIEPLVVQEEITEVNDRVHNLESKFGVRVIRINNDNTLEDLQRSIEGVYISASTEEARRELQNRGKERT